jgi:hypothetical protein
VKPAPRAAWSRPGHGRDALVASGGDGFRPRYDAAGAIPRFAAAYGIEPFWSYDRPGGGLLIANGTGTMLAAMDEIPTLSWCVDVTGLRAGEELDRWLQFAEIVNRACSHVAASLICFIDTPEPLTQLLAAFDPDRLAVYGNASLHPTCQREWPAFVQLARHQGSSS